ncbi:uncharacterized protein LOC135805409 isoform X2 [Sycon ciliatum]|uniref:uncharacterized protein LOC135805409 isoform X2 n=1 Tax=Sycon ciliatum TaxID=27933 RepID=UPI0031F6F93A
MHRGRPKQHPSGDYGSALCLQALTILILAAACAKSSFVNLPGVVPIADRCWPYASDSEREQLFTRQIVNQKTFFRTTESFWCASTNGLTGTVLSLESLSDYNLVDQPSNAQLVRVRWNNGIVAVHRMGIGSKYDLDTPSFSSDVLATFTTAELQAALRPSTVVMPTKYKSPLTDWLEICNSGLTARSLPTGTFHSYNSTRGIVVVEWTSLSPRNTSLGFHRYGNGDFDLCFSGCTNFGQYALTDIRTLFRSCSILAPSPDLLKSVPNSDMTIGNRSVVVGPHFVGIRVLNSTSQSDFSYVRANTTFAHIAFIDVPSTGICIYDNAACPTWTDMRLADLLALVPNGSVISSPVAGKWRGTVIWPPGGVITQDPSGLSDAYLAGVMGDQMRFDYCLLNSTQTMCPKRPQGNTGPGSAAAPPTPAPPQCTLDLVRLFYLVLVPISAVCIIYLSLRKPGKPFRLQLKLSSVVPANLLDFHSDRLLIAVAYVATVQIVFLMFTGHLHLHITTANSVIQEKWLSVVVTVLLTMVIGFSFYSVFAGMTTQHQPEGAIMGLVVSVLFIVFYILRISSCVVSSRTILILQAAPALLCLVILAVYFIIRLVQYILALANKEDMANLLARYNFGGSVRHELPYLRGLLKRQFAEKKLREQEREMAKEKGSLKQSAFQGVWEKVVFAVKDNFPTLAVGDTFSYSPLFLSAIMLGLVCVYMMLVVVVPPIYEFIKLADALRLVASNQLSNDIVILVPAAVLLSAVFATVLIILHSLHMVRCYKRHMLQLYRGDNAFISRACSSTGDQLKAYGRFLGLQAGYIIWGFYIKLFIFLFVLLIITAIILLLKHFAFAREFFYSYILTAIGVSVVTSAVTDVLVAITKDRTSPGKIAVIKYKAMYHNVVYFFVFYHVVKGVISVLLRLISVAAFNTVMLVKLNRPLMPRGWEQYDSGYASYCGFLLIELAHTHPCMLAFIALLQEEVDRPISTKTTKAAKRWHMAYTLVRNPELVALRNNSLKRSAEQDLKQRKNVMNTLSLTISSECLFREDASPSPSSELGDVPLRSLGLQTSSPLAQHVEEV